MTETVLEVNDLHVSFDIAAGEVQAVRGVDFHLNKGETLAIVGAVSYTHLTLPTKRLV